MSLPAVVETVESLRAAVRAWRGEGLSVGLVPTMGALHAGHLALVRRALAETDRAVVSIFVNPTQFAPNEDLARYPRDERGDLEQLARAGAHLAFMPAVGEVYRPGASTRVKVGGLSEGLCAASRPGHFAGMATVVAKLLNMAAADAAFFGEKDYQQLLIVQRLARDLDIPTRIVGVPTVREPDGLALSSRNVHLTLQARRIAPLLHATLRELARALEEGSLAAPLLAQARARLLAAGFDGVDYLELRDARTLAPLPALLGSPGRLLAAAYLGGVRLIDNLPLGAAPG